MTHETVTEPWKVSEFKDTIKEIYDHYMSCHNEWVYSLENNYGDEGKAKNKFISAMATFYSDQGAGFDLYLDKKTTEINPEWYDDIVFQKNKFTPRQIASMHKHLVRWFNTFGAKALTNEMTMFSNPIEGALAEFFQTTNKTKGTANYHDLQPIYNFFNTMLNHPENGIKKNNQDCYFVISGHPGHGKSYLLLAIFTYWYKEILRVKDFGEDYICYFASTPEQHKEGLSDLTTKKWHMLCNDEAGIQGKARNHMTKENRKYVELYDVIRGLNLVHGQALPDFTKMEKTFVHQRIDFVIVTIKKGKNVYARFYSRQRVKDLYEDCMKQGGIPPEKSTLQPNFTCLVPKYEGELLKVYEKRKQKGMASTTEKYFGTDAKQKRIEKGKQLYELIEKQDKGYYEAYNELELDAKTGRGYLQEYCDANKLKLPKKKQQK
jgi:hypothetical protein